MRRPKSERHQAEIERGLALGAFIADPHIAAFLDAAEKRHQANLLNPELTDAQLRAAQTSVLALQSLRNEMKHAAAAGQRADRTVNRTTHD